jgi:para-aminobenzoate synthetase
MPGHNLTLRTRTMARWLDPEQAFLALYAAQDYAFWLDSSLTTAGMARYSVMGDRGGPLASSISYDLRRKTLTIGRPHADDEEVAGDLFDHLQTVLGQHDVAREDAAPLPFSGGLVGYFGYELKSLLINRPSPAASLPDAWFMVADRFVCFDHLEGTVHLACLTEGGAAEADAWFDEVEQRLAQAPPVLLDLTGASARPDGTAEAEPGWSRSRPHYIRDVQECLAEIRDGESYEVCLTNKVHLPRDVEPLAYYLALRRRNPAQYSAFLKMGEFAVACSSPECFLRVGSDRWVESRPIKGTRELGSTEAEQQANRLDLQNSEKDRAENLMIVDLVRNDLGRVCEPGSVHVPVIMGVERYATVWQMVSTVRGRLLDGKDAIDCVKACFPGGSMTGAPKIRTMEIIDRLEQEARSVYSGSIGYLSFDGAADLNIVIRTAVFEPDKISIGVGGAIIALSDTDAEYFEITVKARALIAAYRDTRQEGATNHAKRHSYAAPQLQAAAVPGRVADRATAA